MGAREQDPNAQMEARRVNLRFIYKGKTKNHSSAGEKLETKLGAKTKKTRKEHWNMKNSRIEYHRNDGEHDGEDLTKE